MKGEGNHCLRGAVLLAGVTIVLSTVLVAQVPLYDIDGDAASDRFGASVAGAGDVNNDGFEDLIVGAPDDSDVFNLGPGYARVYSGVDGSTLWTVSGSAPGSTFGLSVDGVGDVNGDGHDDFAVGAISEGGMGVFGGIVRVFSGFDASVLYSLSGDVTGDAMGFAVAGVGDVDNDGVPDIAGCATFSDVAFFNSGTVRVWSGVDGSVIHSWEGAEENARLGASLDSAGDWDGDGWGDVLAGGYRGSVWVFSGKTGGVLKEFPQPAANEFWGASAANVGDVSGDGAPDYLVGAPQDSVFGSPGKGYVRVLNGQTGATLQEFIGDVLFDGFGCAVDSAGDYDADGVTDYLVGASLASVSGQPGYVRIISGATGFALAQFPAHSATSGLGLSLARVGDMNGDGAVEIAVGEQYTSDVFLGAGAVKVYSGTPVICDAPSVYCLAFPNTTGVAADIGYTGTHFHSANDLVLTASHCPPGQSAIFFYGRDDTALFLGSGVLCVQEDLHRLPPVVTIDGAGNVSVPFDLDNLPGGDVIQVGETRYFQLWFRDPGDGQAGTNQSYGLKVTFCP